MRYPNNEFSFYPPYPQIIMPFSNTPSLYSNNQHFPFYNPGVFVYPINYGISQMPLVSHPNNFQPFPIKSSNKKNPNLKKPKTKAGFASPLEDEKQIEKKIKNDFSSLTTFTSSPDKSSPKQISKKDASLFDPLSSTKSNSNNSDEQKNEVKQLMELIDEKPNLVKYINTIKGSKKLQVLIDLELDNSLTLNYLFSKIQLDIGKITNHPFGNYFLQKLIEKSSFATRKKIWEFFFGRRIEDYSLNQYGHFAFLSLLKATSSEEEEISVSSSLKRCYSVLAYYPTGSFIIQTAFDSFKGKGREDLIDFILSDFVALTGNINSIAVLKKFFTETKEFSKDFKECFVSNCLESSLPQIITEKFGCVALQSLIENWGFYEIQDCFMKEIKERLNILLSNRYSSSMLKQVFINELSHKVS